MHAYLVLYYSCLQFNNLSLIVRIKHAKCLGALVGVSVVIIYIFVEVVQVGTVESDDLILSILSSTKSTARAKPPFFPTAIAASTINFKPWRLVVSPKGTPQDVNPSSTAALYLNP